MAKKITQFKVLFSSTSDLQDEYYAIKDVIAELNRTWSPINNSIIELVNYRTHSAPGASIGSPQNLITADLGDDYDLYVGALWKKFGTPTDNAESGTEEEFNHAHNRFLKSPKSLQVLFYFSNAMFAPSEFNHEQYSKVVSFKEGLKKTKNIYYGEYKDIDELKQYLRIHIPQRLMGLEIDSHAGINSDYIPLKPIATPIEIAISEIESVEVEEYGVIEYRELFDANSASVINSMGRITTATQTHSNQLNRKTAQLTKINGSSIHPSTSIVKGHMRAIAKYMNDYSNKLSIEIPIYSSSYAVMIDSAINIINLNGPNDRDSIIKQKNAVLEVIDANIGFRDSIGGAIASIDNIVDMTSDVIKSKRVLKNRLLSLYDELNNSIELSKELVIRYNEVTTTISA